MLLILTFLSILLSFFPTIHTEVSQRPTTIVSTIITKQTLVPNISSSKNSLTLLNYNVTFAEKENPIKIPNMRKRFEELKSKKKTIKKSTRRTVQKIIKKMRRKVYLNAPTAMPTLTNRNQSNTEGTKNVPTATTEQVYQKMHKKQIKIPRYPMPFQKLAHNRESLRNERMHMRNKRNVEKSDLLIFNDLDEMEFVKEKNGYNVVNAHVQRHWR